MTPLGLKKVLADIDKGAEGDNVALWVLLDNEVEYHGYYTLISPGCWEVLILERPDSPPLYVATETIAAITLWSDPPLKPGE